MSTCPDCRYCAPVGAAVPRNRWPNPARWFDQPCLHCSHRLKAHDPGVPGAALSTDLLPAGVTVGAPETI